jgi:drug/metabolite transporter, DME family
MFIGIFFGLVSASIWAATSLAIKAQSATVDTLSFNAFRMVVGAIFFLALLPFYGGWDALVGLTVTARTAMGISIICGTVIGDSLYYWSMTQIGAARAMPLSGIYPLFTWILAVPLLHEEITPQAIMSTILVLAGLYLLAPATEHHSAEDARANRMGVIGALIAAVMWAISTTMVRIGLDDNANIIAINSFRMPLGAIILSVLVMRMRDRTVWKSYTRSALPILIGTSLLSVGIGSIFWILSVQYAGAARASLLNAMAPLIGAPLAVMFLREQITWKIGVGTCLAVLGVALVVG